MSSKTCPFAKDSAPSLWLTRFCVAWTRQSASGDAEIELRASAPITLARLPPLTPPLAAEPEIEIALWRAHVARRPAIHVPRDSAVLAESSTFFPPLAVSVKQYISRAWGASSSTVDSLSKR